ncbi:MAG: NAD(P)H-hydrate dehydratase [Clostridia bacterium]|nr:NAD(P)H-hydrate dehydratase [Clostridia bacterium]
MKAVLTAFEMRESEKKLFDSGVPSISVMERAAIHLTETLVQKLGDTEKTCIFACGAGGNGGDGYAAARLFSKKGGRAIVLTVYPPRNEDAIRNFELAKKTVFAVSDMSHLSSLPTPNAWVDCVFGTGLSREVDENAKSLINRMEEDRKKGAMVLSCDLPTGLNSDTGEVMGACVRADTTVTFEWMKRGHLLGEGPDASGDIVVCDIGVKNEYLPCNCALLIEKEDIRRMLPIRKKTAHKNDFGHLLIIAGSFGMAGAAAMCAKSAMRTGAGLVTILCVRSIVPILQTLVPEAMCVPIDEDNGVISDCGYEKALSVLDGKSAVAIGPGLTRNASKRILEAVLKSNLPAVIDADALNILSDNPYLKKLLNQNHALTPHPGEAKRLLGKLSKDPCENAFMLNDLGAHAILKGATTVCVKDRRILFAASGNSGMAKGGSGDVLTGVIGALMAMGQSASDALWMGSEIHKIAGDFAMKKYGEYSMLPTDTIECIKDAYDYILA